MITATLKKQLRKLPIEQRVDLLEDLALSIAHDQKDLTLPDWQSKMLESRIDEHDKNPSNVISVSALRKKMAALKNEFAARRRNAN